MPQVCHDDLHVWISRRHSIQMPRQCAFERGLRNERRSCVQQYRKLMLLCVGPEWIKSLVVGLEAGVHWQQLDATQPELLVPVAKFLFPTGLGWINRKESNQPIGMYGNVTGHILIVDP